MIPKPPPREGNLGFLYIPPFRVQGTSIAGEATCVQVPELDVCFDMGVCPRSVLSSKVAAISHGHMDHVGGLAYFCSQRHFQGMGPGTIACHKAIAPAVRAMMDGYVELEQQRTPYEIIEMETDQEYEIKNNIFLRMFEVEHTCPSAGYVIYERRSKLKPEYYELPQEKLRELKDQGVDITRILKVPLVAYLGDTQPGPPLIREDVRTAQIVICECTFIEPDHKEKARIGKHMHLDDIAEWLRVLQCQKLVLTHLSRRSNIIEAKKHLTRLVKRDLSDKVEFLMDHKTNNMRYEKQAFEAECAEAERTGGPMPIPPDQRRRGPGGPGGGAGGPRFGGGGGGGRGPGGPGGYGGGGGGGPRFGGPPRDGPPREGPPREGPPSESGPSGDRPRRFAPPRG